MGLSRSTALIALVALLLLTAALGARGLNADAIWYDEWWSIYAAGGGPYAVTSVDDLLARSAEGQPWMPPLHALALAGWGALTGWTPAGMRALSWLAGLLSVACAYRLGAAVARDASGLDPRLVGFGTAAALGGSAFVVYYLHEIRVYALHLLLAVLAIWSYWGMLHPRRSRWLPAAFTLSWAGLLYSHFFGALLLGAMALYHLVAVPKDRRWWITTAAMLAAGLLFVPWLIVALSAGPAQVDPVLRANALTPAGIIERLLFMFSNGGLALLAILLVMSGFSRPARAVWFCLIVLVAAAALGNQVIPVISELRYLLAAWPLLALLTGLGTARLARRGLPPALIWGAWLAAGVWGSLNAAPLIVAYQSPASDTYNHSYANAFRALPWPRLHDTLAARAQPGDALAFHRPDAVWAISGVFDFYTVDLPLRRTLLESLPGRDQDGEYLRGASQFLSDADSERVWLAVDKTLPPTFRLDTFRAALTQAGYADCGAVFDLPNMMLSLYARPSAAPLAVFGEGIAVRLIEPPTRDGKSLRLTALWSVDAAVPPATYSVGWHIAAAGGSLLAQSDAGLPAAGSTCTPVTLDLPPGAATLRLIVYDWATGDRLRTLSGEDQITVASLESPR
ncbi:MAG: hypothetical protein JNM70_04880 [Anaerolineae bacterium]|nr:hypothetical protein [Anaerolineae bacterium]